MTFDPYADWLGIPAGRRPPNHYELIGVPAGETEAARIHEAALARILELRKYQAGKHSELSQRLMNEVSQARLCLLDPVRRTAYDLELAGAEAVSEEPETPAPLPQARTRRPAVRAAVLLLLVMLLTWLAAWRYFEHASSRTGLLGVRFEIVPDEPPADPADPEKPGTPPAAPTSPTAPARITTGQPGLLAKSLRQLRRLPRWEVLNPQKWAEWKSAIQWLPANWVVVDRIGQPVPSLQTEPLIPVNLWFVNSHEHETEPWLDADGRMLHFTRSNPRRDQLLFAHRQSTGDHFTLVGRLRGLPGRGDQQSLLLVDPRRALFASNHGRDDGRFELFQVERPSARGPFGASSPLTSLNLEQGDCLHPAVSADGLTLYFSRYENDAYHAYVAERSERTAPFDAPKRLPFPENFHHPTVTADGKTMFLQGPIDPVHWGIYRSERRTTQEPWPTPAFVHDIAEPVGPLGDVAPAVTADGRFLYFASDRPNGAGGLDLWVVELVDERELHLPSAAAPGALRDWLILGPLTQSSPAATLDQLARLPSPQLRRVPPVQGAIDKRTGLTWRRGPKLDAGPGIYFVSFPFEIKRSPRAVLTIEPFPGRAVFWLDGDQVLSCDGTSPLKEGEKAYKSNPRPLRGAKHRLLGVVQLRDVTAPFSVRLLDATTGETLGEIEPDFRAP